MQGVTGVAIKGRGSSVDSMLVGTTLIFLELDTELVILLVTKLKERSSKQFIKTVRFGETGFFPLCSVLLIRTPFPNSASILASSPFREMGLWTLLEGFLLLANALAILNEDRFLAPRGWGLSDFSGGRTKSFKGQLIGSGFPQDEFKKLLLRRNN
ncbi:hypothetical protein PIB30_066967 [Stylosanthes scabra]|uniref:Uncharacterized protein n=1 Tax=Stylosanthes scabra TaxID=79078 RepID=A0ABU6WKU6_9FABA|nr:hypothetical protein [Stylosanthes scabra]